MSLNIDYFRAIQGTIGINSKNESVISDNKRRLTKDLEKSINYISDAKVNGIIQPLIVTYSKDSFKAKVEALPDNKLYVGDTVECRGEFWIIIEINFTNPIQVTGLMWLCNYKLRFQNSVSSIVEKWGIFDSGKYSSTSDKQIQSSDNQFDIYLPYDNDTKKIFKDKRLAIGTVFDKNENEILDTYKVTSVGKISKSYGTGSHLLLLKCESSEYSPEKDNLSLYICDYIAPSTPEVSVVPDDGSLKCSIIGLNTIRLGRTRKYEVIFYAEDGTTVIPGIVPLWSLSVLPQGVTTTSNGSFIEISTSEDDSLVGAVITLSVTDTEGLYATASIEIGVIDIV